MNRAEKAALQLRAVAILRTLKTSRTYDELAATTGLPAGDLNRYVNGHVLPGVDRARTLVAETGHATLAEELDARVAFDEEGFLDNSDLVFDQPFLDLVAPVAAERLGIDPPDAVLTAATDGITLGAALASHFGARLVYAKKSKETAVDEFVESRQRLPNGMELSYYLPADALSTGDSVVVVDDVIRSGETQTLLLDLADRAGATVAGVFALIGVGTDGIDAVRDLTDAPVATLRTFE